MHYNRKKIALEAGQAVIEWLCNLGLLLNLQILFPLV